MPRTTIGLAELPETPHFLYRLFDRTDTLLYIGITNDPKARFKWHRKNQPWWCDVDQTKTRVDYFPSREAVLKAEAEAIREELPLYNDQHNLTVDTPTRKAVDEALSEFAEIMLANMLGEPDAVKLALEEAATDIAELTEDGTPPETMDPAVHAAAIIGQRLQSALFSYERVIDALVGWLPDDVAVPAYRSAVEGLGVDPQLRDLELTEAAVANIEYEMSRRLLDGLPPDEAEQWVRAARHYLLAQRHRGLAEPDGSNVVRLAAVYARAVRSDNPRLFSAYRCSHKEADGQSCLDLGIHRRVVNGCRRCVWERNGCVGHGNWCNRHYSQFSDGGKIWEAAAGANTSGEVVPLWRSDEDAA